MARSRDREAGGVPWRSRSFQIVLASTLVLPFGAPLLSPTLPLVRNAFAISDVGASYLLSVYFLPGVVLSPLIGRALDRIGRRPVLAVCLFTFGLVGAGIALLDDYSLVLAARFVQGVAAAGIFIATVTLIADSFGGLRRNAVFGVNVAVLSTGRAIYPVFGGWLAGFGWRAPFACYLAAVGVGLFVVRRFDRSVGSPGSRRRVSLRTTLSELASSGAPPLYGATVLAELLVFGAIMTALPFLLVAEYGSSAVTVGAFITATTAASAFVAAANGRLARRFSNHQLVALGFLLFGTGLAGVGTATSLVAVAPPVVVFGAGIGLVLPSVDAAISELVPEEIHASALSLRNSATGFGRGAGPLLFTALAAATGYRAILAGAAVAALGIGVGGLVLARR